MFQKEVADRIIAKSQYIKLWKIVNTSVTGNLEVNKICDILNQKVIFTKTKNTTVVIIVTSHLK